MDENQCVSLLDILSTEVPVKLVVKIGVVTEEDRSKADEYNIPVSQLIPQLLFLSFSLLNLYFR